MAGVRIKKLTLLFPRVKKESILRELMQLGCVEITGSKELLDDPRLVQPVDRDNAELENYRAQLISLTRGLEVIDSYSPSKTRLFAKKPDVTAEVLFDESDSKICLNLAKMLETLDTYLNTLITAEQNLKSIIESLTPWYAFQIPLNCVETAACDVLTGTVASSKNLLKLQAELSRAVPESEMFHISSDKKKHYLCIILIKEKKNEVMKILNRRNFSLCIHKDLYGTAEENIKKAEISLNGLADEKSDILSRIRDAAGYRETLMLCYDHICTKIARTEAGEKLLKTGYSLVLTGWIIAKKEAELQSLASEYECAWEFTEPTLDDLENKPVASIKFLKFLYKLILGGSRMFDPLRVKIKYNSFT